MLTQGWLLANLPGRFFVSCCTEHSLFFLEPTSHDHQCLRPSGRCAIRRRYDDWHVADFRDVYPLVLPHDPATDEEGKEQKQMLDALQKGDEVVAMGIIGRIVKIGDGYIGLEVGDGKVIHMQRQAVTTLLPKGTFNDVTK